MIHLASAERCQWLNAGVYVRCPSEIRFIGTPFDDALVPQLPHVHLKSE